MVKKLGIIFTAGLGCLLLMLAVIWMSDREAPIIEINTTGALDISCELNRQQALSGVSATDNKDGDLTSSIFIEEQSEELILQSGKLTYVVIDEAGNVSKQTRTVTSDNRMDERVIVSQLPKTIIRGEKINLLEYISMKNGCGEDVEGEFNLPDLDTSMAKKIDFIIMDVHQIAKDLEISIEVVDYESPVIILTTDKIKITSEDKIDYLDYIKELDDNNDSKKDLEDSITITGYINLTKDGENIITYTIKDSDGHTASAELIVEVEVVDKEVDDKDKEGEDA